MTVFNQRNLLNMLFLDIETVREFKTLEEFKEKKKFENWKKVVAKFYADAIAQQEDINDDTIFRTKSAIYPEYAKVVCICFGTFEYDATNDKFIKKLYPIVSPALDFEQDEVALLKIIADQFNKAYDKNQNLILTGHNILEFDIPFLIKRMVKHGIKIPIILHNVLMSKPWEAKTADTMKEWKMGTSKIVSMDTLSEFLGLPSSKEGEVNGSNLGDAYWESTDKPVTMKKIGEYCKSDVSVNMDIVYKLSLV